MRALTLFGLFMAGMISSFVATAEKAYAVEMKILNGRKVISDSLVNNLSCNKLNVDNIYLAIRPDAFKEERNMPIRNWAFWSGPAPIAGCWALSSTQRMFSYMARYNETSQKRVEDQVPSVLDMVRGGVLEKTYSNSSNNARPYMVKDLKNYSIIPTNADSLRESSLWSLLSFGFDTRFNSQTVRRDFKSEIEANQANHFFRFKNIGMGLGSGLRSAAKNHETITQLMKNLNGKRLTLLNLRAGRTAQHVVMAKSYQNLGKLIAITVYDSNQPDKDQTVYYHTGTGYFYSPDVMRFFTETEGQHVAAFIVDEAERLKFEQGMLAYYANVCNKGRIGKQ